MTAREYITRAEVMERTGLRRTTATGIMHAVAARAGLDLSERGQRALLLPLDAWETHGPALLAPPAAPRGRKGAAPSSSRPVPPRRPHTPAEAPAVALTQPRGRRP